MRPGFQLESLDFVLRALKPCDPLPLSLTSLLVSSSDCYLDWFLIVFVKLNQNINKYGDDNAVSIWPVSTLYGQAMRTEHLTRSHINVCACVLDGVKNVGNERGDSRSRICNTVWRQRLSLLAKILYKLILRQYLRSSIQISLQVLCLNIFATGFYICLFVPNKYLLFAKGLLRMK